MKKRKMLVGGIDPSNPSTSHLEKLKSFDLIPLTSTTTPGFTYAMNPEAYQMKIILDRPVLYSTSLLRRYKTIEHNLQTVHQDHGQNI